MNDYVQLLLWLIIIAPFSLFWHELGHVFGAKVINATHVTLTIGTGKPIVKRTRSNVTIVIRRLFFFNSSTATKEPYILSNRDKLIITSMGPIYSLVLSLLAYFCIVITMPHLSLYIVCLFNLWIGIINLIPFKINGKSSDGYTILQIIKNKYD